MAFHQNDSVDTSKLILGNYKIETAAYASAAGSFTWVNMGAGMVNAFGHTPTKYDVQSGNAPDPIEGVADEVFTVDMELIEFDASVLSAATGGMMTADTTTSSVLTTINIGGNQVITPRGFRLTNRRLISGATKETIITIFYATMDSGLQVTAKSDNDADPINVMPINITGKNDSTRTVGSQLVSITKTV